MRRRELIHSFHSFCVSLTGHHDGEDRTLFPALNEAHPELGDTIRKFMQDHSMIAHLIGELRVRAGCREVPPTGVPRDARHVPQLA